MFCKLAALISIVFLCECNNDDTNWWCFTDECLKRMLDRSGWEIISYKRFGCQRESEPSSLEKDGRAFVFMKRKP